MVIRGISAARLDTFRSAADTGDIEALARYFHNVALCESPYPSINIKEIALRNNIDTAAANHFNNVLWMDDPVLIQPKEYEKILAAKDKLTAAGKPIEAGRIVAELSLGFWVALFNAPYETPLWRNIISDVFHGYRAIIAFVHMLASD